MSDSVSRRNFVAAATAIPALAASDHVTVGVIGVGSRGYYLTERLFVGSGPAIKVLAVCDTYEGNRNRAKDRVQTMGKNTPTRQDFIIDNLRIELDIVEENPEEVLVEEDNS